MTAATLSPWRSWLRLASIATAIVGAASGMVAAAEIREQRAALPTHDVLVLLAGAPGVGPLWCALAVSLLVLFVGVGVAMWEASC